MVFSVLGKRTHPETDHEQDIEELDNDSDTDVIDKYAIVYILNCEIEVTLNPDRNIYFTVIRLCQLVQMLMFIS